ncbi:MAG: hypothetical protein JWM33_3168 [Caulobacteraceae bacterium]|nr:hypothetical protein [Caulobacteraceae bacterium]
MPLTDKTAWRWTIGLVLAVTVIRIWALFATPLNLYPDEAQYWLWSRELAFGYFSKPPMIAWLIWATTVSHGSSEAWVRIGAPLVNAGTALTLFALGKRLYTSREGLLAAALFLLMPGIALASGVISTDTPLLLFLSLAILFYALAGKARKGQLGYAAGMGAMLGLAMLSKYAALYALGGLILHLIVSPQARRKFGPACWLAMLAPFALVISPNVVWNAAHGFATVSHTAANADFTGKLFNPAEFGEFFIAQFGVFGPIPFGVLLSGLVVLSIKRRLSPADTLLLCFAAPPLAIILVEAILVHANANWAAATYVPGSVLVAAWLLRWRAKAWMWAALGLQAVVAVAFIALVVSPRLQERLNMANSFKRAKGWDEINRSVVERARIEDAQGLTAVAVDDRFLFNELAYYGRDYFGKEGPPLAIWTEGGVAHNQAEAAAPLTAANGGRVLVASLNPDLEGKIKADFAQTPGEEILRVTLDRKRSRRTDVFVGEGYKGGR